MQPTPRLLVVDDEFFNRDMLRERLVRNGYEVAEAEDAQQALEVIERGGIDLVLLDTMMPGMSGIDLLRLLRGVHGPSELPVIMATAVTDSDSVAGALELGANDYVSKPIDFPVALARIRSQLHRKAAEEALRASEERLALAMRGAGDGIWDWDLTTGTLFYSARWKAILGCAECDIGDTPDEWFQRVHPEERDSLRSRIESHWTQSAAGEPFVAEYRMLHNDGTYHWMRGRAHTVLNSSGTAVRMIGTQTDITEQKVFDALTGLPNRLLFLERAARSLDHARQCPGHLSAVLFLDVDRFKLVNDSLGHSAGDRLLIGIAERLRGCVRGGRSQARAWDDLTVARFGGDEFAVLLEDIRQPADAELVARRILQALEDPIQAGEKRVSCGVSIGIALGHPSYDSVQDMLRDADTAMYAAKAIGGSRYAVFDDTMRQRTAARLEIETGLATALANSELEVYYQPKVNLDTELLVGFEALVRWNHPGLGVLSPSAFIPVAEETGRIVAIGEWVIRTACLQMLEWHRQYPKIPPLAVSVNLSIRQFRQPDLVESVARILAETGLAPEFLQLEITESVLMDDPESAICIVQRLKSLGIGIKLDDFGAEYSSLTYLCRMPVDALKIDRSFIVRMLQSPTDMEIIRAVLGLAESLGMEVIAEGVERLDQMAQLRSMGCHFAQGYYFGKPISSEDTALLLASTDESGRPISAA